MADPTKQFRLDGKVALVTGGSRGLGKAMAVGMAEVGAKLVVASRKLDNCEQVAEEIRRGGGEALAASAHMGDAASINRLIESSYERFGRVDVLVNNAGINPSFATLSDASTELFDKLFDVNVKGPWYLASRLAPRMRDSGGGSVINVISVGGLRVGAGVGIYSANKAALQAFTKVMAIEWAGWNIRVNALAPGSYDTDMMRNAIRIAPEFEEGAKNASLQKRIADPREIVGSALYLASDASSFTTGETLVTDGGYMLS